MTRRRFTATAWLGMAAGASGAGAPVAAAADLLDR
jgi:hypothetical protein